MNPPNPLKMLTERNDRGYTLIEVLVAMIILSIGLLGGAALIVGIIQGNSRSDRLTTATLLAQEKMEDIRGLAYSGAADSTEDYNSITNYPLFKRITSVVASSPAANMKTVTVTVFWDSDNKSVVLRSILAKEG